MTTTTAEAATRRKYRLQEPAMDSSSLSSASSRIDRRLRRRRINRPSPATERVEETSLRREFRYRCSIAIGVVGRVLTVGDALDLANASTCTYSHKDPHTICIVFFLPLLAL